MTDRTVFNESLSGVINLEIAGERIEWHVLDKVTSTMDYTVSLIEDTASIWTLVTAVAQNGGRGTHGRNWVSPDRKGLYLSLAVPPPRDTGRIEELSMKTAAVLVDTLRSILNLSCVIKHPNDVFVNGRKIAGILYESKTSGGTFAYMVLGLGLNMSQTADDFRKAELPEATSLLIETGHVPGINDVLLEFLKRFIPMYKDLSGVVVAGEGGTDTCELM